MNNIINSSIQHDLEIEVKKEISKIISDDDFGEARILGIYDEDGDKDLMRIVITVMSVNLSHLVVASKMQLEFQCMDCNKLNNCSEDEKSNCQANVLVYTKKLARYLGKFKEGSDNLILTMDVLDKHKQYYYLKGSEYYDLQGLMGYLDFEDIFNIPNHMFAAADICSENGYYIMANNSQQLLIPSLLEDNCYMVQNILWSVDTDYKHTRVLGITNPFKDYELNYKLR